MRRLRLSQWVWAVAAALLVLWGTTGAVGWLRTGETHAPAAHAAAPAQPPLARLAFVDPEFKGDPVWGSHPVYEALRRQAAAFEDDGDRASLIAANLERARALPPPPGRRFILVNVPEGRLYMYEDRRVAGSMKVVVGSRREQTPEMAGLMQFVVVNPYWNVPVDLVRDSIAPRVLAGGAGYFRARGFEALSSWDADAVRLDPARIDWRAVADGRTELRVRQRPGGDNMMGTAKFMLPNELGIYLHDTPHKAAFLGAQRLISSGCVRVEDSARLMAWVFGGRPPVGLSDTDLRVDLTEPVAVYITYLTVAPSVDGLAFHPDVYGRDPALLDRLEADGRRLAAHDLRAAA